jgi:hypothetical protein
LDASSKTQGQELQDLFINWQKLIRERVNAREGTQVRRELDTIYLKALPTIVAITESVSDQEINGLIQVASKLLTK